jgi:F0F1-type ATP synthase assembly protein I
MAKPDGDRRAPSGLEKALIKRARASRSLGYATMIPTMLGVGPLLGFLLGSLLERRFGGAPWLSFGGVVLGGIASVRQVILLLQRERSDSKNGRPGPPPER